MAASIAYSNLNYDEYSGWWLKAYSPSTTVALTMYNDADKSQGYAKIQIDSEGFPASSGGARFIPFIEGYFDLYLFPTESEADSNDTNNAVRLAANITAESLVENAVTSSYANTGLAQTLSSAEVDVYFDTKDTPSPVVPEVYKHPDMLATEQAITRALEAAGVGGNGAVSLGDGILTLRDLDANTAYLREKLRFVRADYPDFDALMGPYIPESYDFSTGSYSTVLLTDSGDPTTNANNSYVNRQVLEWGTDFAIVKHNEIVIISKQNHTIDHTITVPAAYSNYLFQGAVAGTDGKLYVMMNNLTGTSSQIQFVLLSYDTPTSSETFLADTSTLYDLGYSTTEVGRFAIIFDPATQSIFMCTSGAVNLSAPDELAGITRYNIGAGTWTLTAIKAPVVYDTNSDQNNHSFFWDANAQEIKFVVQNATGTSYMQNLPPRIVSVKLAQLNSTPSTKLVVQIDDTSIKRLPDVDSLLGFERAPAADSVLYNERGARVIHDPDANELYLFSNYPEATGTTPLSGYNIMGLRYDLERMKLLNVITSRDFLDAGIGGALTDNLIPLGSLGSYDNNKVAENVYITIENKDYFPLALSTTFGVRRLTFINMQNDGSFDILEGYSYATNPDGLGGNFDVFSNHVFKYDDDTFVWLDARGSGLEAALTFRRYTLTDDVFTNTTRPAPNLDAISPVKGYFLAK